MTAETFLTSSDGEDLLVAEADGQLLGFASVYAPDDFLHSLYVDEAWRGRGVGSALFAEVVAAAAGPVSLKVQKLNLAAIDFYLRRGMTVVEAGEPEAPGGGWFRMRA